MTRHSDDPDRTNRPGGATVLAVATVLGLVTAGLAGPAAAVGPAAVEPGAVAGDATGADADGHSVTNVTVTVTDGNLTMNITAANVTEVDVTGVPEAWSVADYRDDFGTFRSQVDENHRVVWLWPAPVAVNVSVTFVVDAPDAWRSADLEVVPYAGTDRGDPVTPGTPATPGATDTPEPTSTPTATAMTAVTDGSGPGFGVLAALAGIGAILVALRRRRH